VYTCPYRINHAPYLTLSLVIESSKSQNIESDTNMWAEYYLLIVLTALGALQLAVQHSKIRTLQLTNHYPLTRFLGRLLLFVPSIWFFSTQNRNLPDTNGGLDGGDQAVLFVGGCLTALIITLSISHTKRFVQHPLRSKLKGIEALYDETYISAVLHNLRILRAKWKI